MNPTDLRAMRMRFLVLPVLVFVCVIVSTLHIRRVGTRYEYAIDGYGDARIEKEDLQVEPPTMARILDVYERPDGTAVATIEGIEPGEGMLAVNLGDQGGTSQLHVTDGNVVIADGANFTGWKVLPASVALCFCAAGILCVWALHTLRQHVWYGYEMAAYAGGAVFCLIEAVTFFCLLVTGGAGSFVDFAIAVTNLANSFVNVLLVPMAAAALFICASNVALIRHEGLRPTNALGIATSIMWSLACLALWRLDEAALASESAEGYVVVTMLGSVVSIGVCYALALFAGTCTCAWGAAKHVPSDRRDYLVILGCGLKPDGTPSPLLAGRVDAAVAFAQAQEKVGLGIPKFVPSGGQGPDEACSEAESMKRYLVGLGISESRIVCESRSTNTRENFAFSADVISADGGEDCTVAFATTNYHVFRGYVFAHEAGLNAEGIASATKLYFWPNAFLREFVGLIAAHRMGILLSYLAVAGIYLAAEYVVLSSFG